MTAAAAAALAERWKTAAAASSSAGGAGTWAEHARALQLQIRDRFRVAVDRHRRWAKSESADRSDYYSAALGRWADRLRAILVDQSPSPPARSSSLRFYRKRVDKYVGAMDDSTIIRMLQAVAVPVIGNACHVFMHGLNQVQVYGAEKLHQQLLQRPEGKPLLTVSNHVASMDDPLVIASLIPPSAMLDARNLRWTLCATDRCFKNPVLSTFFRCVKVLPVSRGDGVYQKGMDLAISKLNNGGWVHIFPEGSRSKDGGRTIGSAKRGVGRLVVDADHAPIVIPFVHTGMQEIMPIGSNFPKIGKKVIVLVGDPIHLDDLLSNKDDPQTISSGILYDAVSSRIGHRLHELKDQVDMMALDQSFQAREFYAQKDDHVWRIWQKVDWEAFGMENFMTSERECHVAEVVQTRPMSCVSLVGRPASTRWYTRMSYLDGGGIVSRIQSYMNPSELMGFAAKGLFINGRIAGDHPYDVREGPLKEAVC